MRYICTMTRLEEIKALILELAAANEDAHLLAPQSLDDLTEQLRGRMTPEETAVLPAGLIQAALDSLQADGKLLCVEGE